MNAPQIVMRDIKLTAAMIRKLLAETVREPREAARRHLARPVTPHGVSTILLSPSLTPQLPGLKQFFCFFQGQILFVHRPRYVRRADEGISPVRLFEPEH
jgi:hypothetical protein